jgi:DNA repair protein RecO (recombination protein O)
VHTLSREYGRRSFLVRSVGKKALALFLPLNILEAEIIETTKSNLYTAKKMMLRYPLMGIRNDMFKNSMTMFMSEVLYRTIKDGCNEEGLYEWCEKVILLLDAMKTDFSNFHLRFLLELCIALGFSPQSSDLKPFVGDNYPLAEKFIQSDFAQSMLIPLNGQTRNQLAEDILRYIEFHTESTLSINSLKVLRELFI